MLILNSVIIKISITTFDDELARKIEPRVTSSTRRFEVVQKLSESGLYTGVLMTPVLTFLTDTEENVLKMIEKTKNAGAKFLYSRMGMNLKTNQKNRISGLFNFNQS